MILCDLCLSASLREIKTILLILSKNKKGCQR